MVDNNFSMFVPGLDVKIDEIVTTLANKADINGNGNGGGSAVAGDIDGGTWDTNYGSTPVIDGGSW